MIATAGVALDGLWRAFAASASTSDESLFIALRDGMIVGADHAYWFTGHYSIEDRSVVVTVESHWYAGSRESLWGWRDGAELELSGEITDPEDLQLEGHFIGEPALGRTLVLMRRLTGWRP